MPPRLDRTTASPLDYIKYAFGILAALLVVPAFLQGALAFVQTFLQTLLSIVLTLNLLLLSAVAGGVGIWWWQRRSLAGSAGAMSPEPIATLEVESPRLDRPEPVEPAIALTEARSPANEPAETADAIVEAPTSAPEATTTPTTSSTESETASESRSTTPTPPVAAIATDAADTADAANIADALPPNTDRTVEAPLIQAQLARRLGVSSSTIGTRKLRADFSEWSQQKDPQQLAWRYCEEARQFFVLSA